MRSLEDSTRLAFIAHLCPQQLADLLNCLGDPAAMLKCSLRLALCVVSAERGVAFDSVGAMTSIGLTDDDAWWLRERLLAFSMKADMVLFGRNNFAELSALGEEVHAMAAVIPVHTAVYVVAVERSDAPISEDQQQDLLELFTLIRRPLEQTAELLWMKQALAERKIEAQELPLNRLQALPQLARLEMMLIEEALNRSHGNKSKAALVLGISREGLRKKYERLARKLQLAEDRC